MWVPHLCREWLERSNLGDIEVTNGAPWCLLQLSQICLIKISVHSSHIFWQVFLSCKDSNSWPREDNTTWHVYHVCWQHSYNNRMNSFRVGRLGCFQSMTSKSSHAEVPWTFAYSLRATALCVTAWRSRCAAWVFLRGAFLSVKSHEWPENHPVISGANIFFFCTHILSPSGPRLFECEVVKPACVCLDFF